MIGTTQLVDHLEVPLGVEQNLVGAEVPRRNGELLEHADPVQQRVQDVPDFLLAEALPVALPGLDLLLHLDVIVLVVQLQALVVGASRVRLLDAAEGGQVQVAALHLLADALQHVEVPGNLVAAVCEGDGAVQQLLGRGGGRQAGLVDVAP